MPHKPFRGKADLKKRFWKSIYFERVVWCELERSSIFPKHPFCYGVYFSIHTFLQIILVLNLKCGMELKQFHLYCTVFSLCCPYHFVFYVLFFSICIFPLFPIFSLPFFPRVQLLCKLSCYLALIKDRFPRVLIAMEIFYTVQIQSYEVLQTKFAFFLN